MVSLSPPSRGPLVLSESFSGDFVSGRTSPSLVVVCVLPVGVGLFAALPVLLMVSFLLFSAAGWVSFVMPAAVRCSEALGCSLFSVGIVSLAFHTCVFPQRWCSYLFRFSRFLSFFVRNSSMKSTFWVSWVNEFYIEFNLRNISLQLSHNHVSLQFARFRVSNSPCVMEHFGWDQVLELSHSTEQLSLVTAFLQVLHLPVVSSCYFSDGMFVGRTLTCLTSTFSMLIFLGYFVFMGVTIIVLITFRWQN